jgi:hypothetical protein
MASLSAKERAACAALDALYARLPVVACRGECGVACGPIPLTDLEARRLQAATHRKPRTIALTVVNAAGVASPREQCVYLTEAGRCAAYAARPLICRAWGVVQALSCIRGCVPAAWLSPIDFVAIAQAVEILGGGRLLRTSAEGLTHNPDDTFRNLAPAPGRTREAIEADAERTRTLRALHGGRILAVVKTED